MIEMNMPVVLMASGDVVPGGTPTPNPGTIPGVNP
jgi:hypothetical protein